MELITGFRGLGFCSVQCMGREDVKGPKGARNPCMTSCIQCSFSHQMPSRCLELEFPPFSVSVNSGDPGSYGLTHLVGKQLTKSMGLHLLGQDLPPSPG